MRLIESDNWPISKRRAAREFERNRSEMYGEMRGDDETLAAKFVKDKIYPIIDEISAMCGHNAVSDIKKKVLSAVTNIEYCQVEFQCRIFDDDILPGVSYTDDFFKSYGNFNRFADAFSNIVAKFEKYAPAFEIRNAVSKGNGTYSNVNFAIAFPEGNSCSDTARMAFDSFREGKDLIEKFLRIWKSQAAHLVEISNSRKAVESGYSNNSDYVGDWFGEGQIDFSKVINPDASGDVYMVKLWGGSGYLMDVYLAKAYNVYDAIDSVLDWSYVNEGNNDKVFDYDYLRNLASEDYESYLERPDHWSCEEGLSEEEFIDWWIDDSYICNDDYTLFAYEENFFADKVPEKYLANSRKAIKSSRDIKTRIDRKIESYELPFECVNATIDDGHLDMTIVEYLKGYGSSKTKENVINGKGDGESFEFDDTLKYEEAVCLPYLVKQGTSYPTAYFQDVYKRKDAVPFSTATIHLIKEYD